MPHCLIARLAIRKAQSCALSLIMPLPNSISPSIQAVSSFFSSSVASGPSSGPVSMCAFQIKLLPSPVPGSVATALTLSSVINCNSPLISAAASHWRTASPSRRSLAWWLGVLPSCRQSSTKSLFCASMALMILSKSAFFLSFCLERIDRFADVGYGYVFLKCDFAGLKIDVDCGTAHAGFPKQRKCRAQTGAGSHVAAADQFAAGHAEVCADDFSIAQTLLAGDDFFVV